MADAINLSSKEILKYVLEGSMLDLYEVQSNAIMMSRSKLLKQYKYAIWQGGNGKWYI